MHLKRSFYGKKIASDDDSTMKVCLRHSYQKLIEACGVDSFTEVNAFKPNEIADVIRSRESLPGVHVVWISGSCARIPDPVSTYRRENLYPEIQAEKCADCRLCYDTLACPAIEVNENQKFEINLDRCMRCGVCHEICPNEAIIIQKSLHLKQMNIH